MKRRVVSFLSADLYNFYNQDKSNTFGGVSRIFRVVEKLSATNMFEINCFIGDFGQPAVLEKGNVKLFRSPIDRRFRFIDIYRILARHESDLIIDFYASARLFILFFVKKIHKKPYIFFTGNDPDVNGNYKKRTNFLFYILYVLGLKNADKIICQTPEQAKMLEKTYGLSSSVVLSPYIEVLPPLDLPKEYILWVGRSAYQKNPEYFLELAECFPEEQFVMICNPSDHDKGKHKKIIEYSQRLSNVAFSEAVPHDQIRKYFSGAKLLVNTSEFEGFPNTFIEAALERTPVVSLWVDPNKMFEIHGSGLCCFGDKEKLAAACKNLIENETERKKMGDKARLYAENNHNIDQSMPQIIDIIQGVLNSRV